MKRLRIVLPAAGLALLAARSRVVSELATPLVSAAAAVPIVAAAVCAMVFSARTAAALNQRRKWERFIGSSFQRPERPLS